jgi:peptidoglycan/LPS O-acetylase OafA/YrhL
MISYSFYLWQFVAINFGIKFIKSYPDINLHLVILMSLAVNLFLSVLSYHFFEERTRRFILMKFDRKVVQKDLNIEVATA